MDFTETWEAHSSSWRPTRRLSTTISPSDLHHCYYYRYSALGPFWAETRAQSGDWNGYCTLHPGQVLRDSLPLLSPLYHCILKKMYVYEGILSTTHINFSMSPTIEVAVWRNTEGLYTVLQAVSNCLVVSALGQAATCASYCYWQQFVAWRVGQALDDLWARL